MGSRPVAPGMGKVAEKTGPKGRPGWGSVVWEAARAYIVALKASSSSRCIQAIATGGWISARAPWVVSSPQSSTCAPRTTMGSPRQGTMPPGALPGESEAVRHCTLGWRG